MLPLMDADNAVEILNEVNPSLWGDNKATTLMLENSYKQINHILVHHDAMLWYEFHDEDNWDCEIELDDNGYLVTPFTCRLDADEQVSDVVLSYYGARLDYEHYDY